MTASPLRRLSLSLLLLLLAPHAASADEIAQWRVDLDGDRKPETVRIAVTPAKEDWRSVVTVTVDGQHFSTSFHSADGEIPNVWVVALDFKKPERQILVTTPEPASCLYELLGWHAGQLVRLLSFDGGPGCEAPEIRGLGDVITRTREGGFWLRPQAWRLNAAGSALERHHATDLFDMDVTGAAGKDLVLGGATCKTQAVAPGAFVRLTRFDVRRRRYLVETPAGACGWLPAAEVESNGGKIEQLPFGE